MRTELVIIRLNWEALGQRNCDEDRAGENQANLGGGTLYQRDCDEDRAGENQAKLGGTGQKEL